MTNKDYKRLTVWNDKLQRPCMTSEGSNEQTVDIVTKHVDRLYELENAIENGMLVFLPCKVGDEFWWIFHASKPYIVDEKVQSIEISEEGISIIDIDDHKWYLDEIYFTKEAAQKALEELEK